MDSNYNPEVVPTAPIEPWPIHGGCEDNVLRKIQGKLSGLEKGVSSQGDIIDALKSIKPAVVALFALLTTTLSAAVEPLYTPMWNVPGNVDVMTNICEWASAKRYALFLIHLNPNSASHPFSDIELKATTNNYYGSSMMFYCASSVNGDPERSGNPQWNHDWCRIYVLTSKVDSDVRRWKRIRNTTDLGSYNPREMAIIVDPSSQYLRRGQGSAWLKESNDELIWSYVRITASGPEMDEGGTKQLWRPTMPVKWYATLPEWANQTSY